MEGNMNRALLLDTADTVILLLDRQNGLFQTVKNVPLTRNCPTTVIRLPMSMARCLQTTTAVRSTSSHPRTVGSDAVEGDCWRTE